MVKDLHLSWLISSPYNVWTKANRHIAFLWKATADKLQVNELLNNTRLIPEIFNHTSHMTAIWAQLKNMSLQLNAVQEKLENCSFAVGNSHVTEAPPTTPTPGQLLHHDMTSRRVKTCNFHRLLLLNSLPFRPPLFFFSRLPYPSPLSSQDPLPLNSPISIRRCSKWW